MNKTLSSCFYTDFAVYLYFVLISITHEVAKACLSKLNKKFYLYLNYDVYIAWFKQQFALNKNLNQYKTFALFQTINLLRML